MRTWFRKLWPYFKALFTVAIVAAVGWRFAVDWSNHPEVWQHSLHFGWLTASGVLYQVGLCFFALFWYRMLREMGQNPSVPAATRAYFVGHLGKYLPGKAWALLLRCSLVSGPGVHMGFAAMTTFFEVLTSMASGALLALVLFAILAPDSAAPFDLELLKSIVRKDAATEIVLGRRDLVMLSAGLLAFVGFFIVPPVFNRLIHHLSLPFREKVALPRLGWRTLGEGMLLTSVGWLFLGLSLAAVLRSIPGVSNAWDPAFLGRTTASLGTAYVAGFVIVFVPAGLAVREYLLAFLLAPDIAAATELPLEQARVFAELAAVMLRIVWTVSEVVVAAVVWWLPGLTTDN